MKLELLPLLDYGLEQAVVLMNLGFSDYFVHFEMNLPAFLGMARSESIDLSSSRILWQDGQAAGLALIARRGWNSRLAAMCLTPAARRQGVGRASMNALLAEAEQRGERVMELEVIEENTPAVRLYQSSGFQTIRRLVSFETPESVHQETQGEQPVEVDIRQAARQVTLHGLSDLPWQVSGESLANSGPPGKAFSLEQAYIIISNPEAEQVAIRAVVVAPQARGQGQARRLILSVMAGYPGRKWLVSALCPEELGGLFERLGFVPGRFSQLHLRRALSA